MKRVALLLCVLAVSFIKADLIDTLGEGTICYVDTTTEQTYTIPSARTDLAAVVTDGFVYGRLTQTFVNPLAGFLEATYIFPLPENGAVHGMCVVTESEVIWGEIKEKEEAQAIYDSAKAQGRTTALLVQNRPNVFTQQVANIAPGETLKVVITYSSPLEYFRGTYEMSFPTTVGPRFNPAGGQSLTNPVYVPPGERNGASLGIKILLMTGYSPMNLVSPSHAITTEPALPCLQKVIELGMAGESDQGLLATATWIELGSQDVLPNQDFVLRFDRTSAEIDYSFNFYRQPLKSDTGYFSMTIFPSLADTGDTAEQQAPLELVIMIDESGSTSGWPLAKEKELAQALLDKVTGQDLINVMTFDNGVEKCFAGAVPATAGTLAAARAWVNGRVSGGGTVIMNALNQTLVPPAEPGGKKVVAFMTDAYVGNDQEVLAAIANTPIADLSFFSFGIGNAVNRYLIEEMGRIGNGMGEVVLLADAAQPVIDRFWTCIKGPQLSTIAVDFGSAGACDLVPAAFRTLYDGQPLTVFGKYTGPGPAMVRVTAEKDGRNYARDLPVTFPMLAPINRVLPKVWARQQVRMIELDPAQKARITELGLAYSIMTAYTSFVAVSDSIANTTGTWTSAEIAALWPDGVDPVMAGGTFIHTGQNPGPATEDYSYGSVDIKADACDRSLIKGGFDWTFDLAPNPAGERFTVRFELVRTGKVTVTLHDADGNLVAVLTEQTFTGGSHLIAYHRELKPGIYFIQVESGSARAVKRLLIIKEDIR